MEKDSSAKSWIRPLFAGESKEGGWKAIAHTTGVLLIRAVVTVALTILAFRGLLSQQPSCPDGEDCSHTDEALPSRYLFVFGDSYTTTGYNFTHEPQPSLDNPLGNPTFPGARLSGGKIWVDILAEKLKDTVVYDFAVGGNVVNATQINPDGESSFPIHDFRGQLREFETLSSGGKVPWNANNSVFINMFGIDDVAVQVFEDRNWTTAKANLQPDNGDYFDLLDRMYHLGAHKIITVLVPPIARAPIFDYGRADSSSAAEIRNGTEWWNNHIHNQNGDFLAHHSEAHSKIFDPTPVFDRILDNPEAYGAPNSTCASYPQGEPCLWHDFIHPGKVIQHEFGESMVEVVKSMEFI